MNALERKGHYSHIIPSLRQETELACCCADIQKDMGNPSLYDAKNVYSSANIEEMGF